MADVGEIDFLDLRKQDRDERPREVEQAYEQLEAGECLVVVNDYELEPLFERLDGRLDDCYSFDRYQVGMDVCLGVIYRGTDRGSEQYNGVVSSTALTVV